MKLKHENILQFHGIVEGFGLLPALVSPWMENGSLDQYLKKWANISSAEALGMVRTVSSSQASSDKFPVKADSGRPRVLCVNNSTVSCLDQTTQ